MILITIDGCAATGKSTIAKLLSKKLGYYYLNTGAMYRCITLLALRDQINVKDDSTLAKIARSAEIKLTLSGTLSVYLNGEDVTNEIRTQRVTNACSYVSMNPLIRNIMVKRQRKIIMQNSPPYKGAVIEGRDIGTEVFPNAQYKFFFLACFETRVKRRHSDLTKSGLDVTVRQVAKEMKLADRIEHSRSVGQLKSAPDSIILDNSNLTVEESVRFLHDHVRNFPQATNNFD